MNFSLIFLALPSLLKTPQHSWYYGIHGTKFLDAVQESQRALSKRLGIVADFGCRFYYNITQFYHSFYCRQIVVYSSLCRDETLSSVVGKNYDKDILRYRRNTSIPQYKVGGTQKPIWLDWDQIFSRIFFYTISKNAIFRCVSSFSSEVLD